MSGFDCLSAATRRPYSVRLSIYILVDNWPPTQLRRSIVPIHATEITAQFTTSMATPNPLDGIVHLLNRADLLAEKVKKPVNEVNSGLDTSCSCVNDVQKFISDLNSMSSIITDIQILAEILGTALDEIGIGVILQDGAEIMGKFNSFLHKFLDPINKFKKDVLDEVQKILNDLYKVTSKVNDAVNMFATK